MSQNTQKKCRCKIKIFCTYKSERGIYITGHHRLNHSYQKYRYQPQSKIIHICSPTRGKKNQEGRVEDPGRNGEGEGERNTGGNKKRGKLPSWITLEACQMHTCQSGSRYTVRVWTRNPWTYPLVIAATEVITSVRPLAFTQSSHIFLGQFLPMLSVCRGAATWFTFVFHWWSVVDKFTLMWSPAAAYTPLSFLTPLLLCSVGRRNEKRPILLGMGSMWLTSLPPM